MFLPHYIQFISLLPLTLALYKAGSFYRSVKNEPFARSWIYIIAFTLAMLSFVLGELFLLPHQESYGVVSSLGTLVSACFLMFVIHVAASNQQGLLDTHRKKQILRQAHGQLQKLIENLPTGAVLINDGMITLNKAAEQITGYHRSEFSSLDDWFDKIYQGKSSEVRKIYHETIDVPSVCSVVTVRRKNGDLREVMFNAYREDNLEVWIMNDITEYNENMTKFQILFDNSTDAYLLLNAEGIIDCNKAAVKQLGLERKEELLKLHPAIFSPEYQPCGATSLEKSIRMDALASKNGSHSFEWVHKKVNGEEFPVLVTVMKVLLNHKEVFFTIWHDLTLQKKHEAQLSYASKMSSLGEMAGGLAHELNNPLTIIKGKAQLLMLDSEMKGSLSKEALLPELESIDITCTRMAKIIKGLKTFSRESSNDPFLNTPLAKIIEETLYFCSARFKNLNIKLEADISSDLSLECRPVEISQVLLNLLNNACDAVTPFEERWIKIVAVRRDEGISIFVSDSGPGIPDKVAIKILDPFFTTKEPGKGTGLGLSISKGIVENHGGKISLINRKQTTFEVWLPLQQNSKLSKAV